MSGGPKLGLVGHYDGKLLEMLCFLPKEQGIV